MTSLQPVGGRRYINTPNTDENWQHNRETMPGSLMIPNDEPTDKALMIDKTKDIRGFGDHWEVVYLQNLLRI